jgi:hypothetical protein
MERDPQLPRPIDDGRVAQAIVEYTGRRTGAVTYRGPSGRQYRFAAGPSDRMNYVLEEDLERFRRLVDFRVLEETLIDPEADRIRRLESDLAALHADAESREARLAETVGGVLRDHEERQRRRPPRKRGGRPPVPLRELQRLWHLRHHSLPLWSIEALAAEFLTPNYETPHATISTRLSRFNKDHPELTVEDRCPWCAEGYDPQAPDQA